VFLDVIAATVIIVIGAQYSAAMIPFIIGVLYLLQKFYLRTSRQMRFLDIETKSPLYTLYTETLAGAVTVRAFGWEDVFLDEHQRRLDHSQKPYYLMLCLQRWLSVVLDLLTAGMAVAVVAFAVLFTGTSSSSAIGLAFLNIVKFSGNLMGLVHMWTQLEMSLGAIARVRDFVASTPHESAPDDSPAAHPSPSGWPTAGAIAFNDVVASYSPDLEPALRGVTLTIPPGSKVAICGRTGSGKSSILLTVLRLLDLRSGSVIIDGIDLAHLAHEDIRVRIASLPQDPVTVPGTVRTNLAPPRLSWSSPLPLPGGEGHSPPSDEDLVTALQTARIWDIISSRGGLDADFDSLALSPGQRQLFCLAAAAVRKSKVVLLDEVTGSVDFETDAEVRRALLANKDFLGTCTVVEVVHRIEMVMGYDLVAVVDEGRVVEVGKPGDLMEGGGRFAELWEGRGRNREEQRNI
jgi:ATP-binding cassette, subfamily C (CFTR/MRP), member 1